MPDRWFEAGVQCHMASVSVSCQGANTPTKAKTICLSYPQLVCKLTGIFGCRKEGFTLTASYTEDSPLPEGFERQIAVWKVAAPPGSKGGAEAKLKVRVLFQACELDRH